MSQSCKKIVSFKALSRERANTHRCEKIPNELNLPFEFHRSSITSSLIFGILISSEGMSGNIKGDRNMARLIFLENLNQH